MTTESPQETMYRQGDVLIVAIDKIPDDVAEVPRDKRRGVILQEGKVTGHAHRIAGAARLFSRGAARFLCAVEPVDVVHDEHDTIPLPAGNYQIVIHHEFEPAAPPRQVED